MGSIKLIIGPMFAGKTTRLINYVERYHYGGRKCIIIKHTVDTRYNHLIKTGGIVCNNGIEYSKIRIHETETLAAAADIIGEYDVIGVMESQFFDDILLLDDWATNGKVIICDGLDGDFNRENFGNIHLLIPKCEKVVKLDAVCSYCGANASFTKKISPSKEIIDIGGANKYLPVCRRCYSLGT